MNWPQLEYSEWKPTYETLHRWIQIIGKLRLCTSPVANHSWNTTLYISSRGFTTTAIPMDDRNLTVEFDFITHMLVFNDSLGKHAEMPLKEESVASFYRRALEALKSFNITPSFNPTPNELADATPFDKDEAHCTYNREQAFNCFQVLVRVSNVLQDFRSEFIGKSSPVHFFWGSFDLAVTRFSGRRAPEHPGGIPHLSDEVVKEAYSHEVISCGFWPGNEMYPHAAFYAYAYPEPDKFSNSRVSPPEAFYHPDIHEFILDYDKAISTTDPRATIKSFFASTYRAAANLAQWDTDLLEVSPHLFRIREIVRSYSGGPATRQ